MMVKAVDETGRCKEPNGHKHRRCPFESVRVSNHVSDVPVLFAGPRVRGPPFKQFPANTQYYENNSTISASQPLRAQSVRSSRQTVTLGGTFVPCSKSLLILALSISRAADRLLSVTATGSPVCNPAYIASIRTIQSLFKSEHLLIWRTK